MAQVSFQYDVIQDKTARKHAESQAKAIKDLIHRSGEAVVEIGRRLQEVHGAITPAMFRAWVEVEFSWTMSTVSNYMQAARVFGDVDCLGQFQPAGIVALARRNVPESVIQEALKLARGGSVITGKVAKRLLDHAGVQPSNPTAGKARKPETAAAAMAVAAVQVDSAAALRQTLDAFVANMDQLAASMSFDDRNALADRFLQLALQIRAAHAPAAVAPKSPRKRKVTAAA